MAERTLIDISTASQEEVSVYHALKDGGEINHNEIVVYVRDRSVRSEDYAYVSLTREEARALAYGILRGLSATEPDNWSDEE